MRLIGISGKPGSNKMFYAFRIIRELRIRGYNTELISLAKPLYKELNCIADDIVEHNKNAKQISAKYNLGEKGSELYNFLNPEYLGEKNLEYGYSRRNENFRKALELLGTGIRREQDEDYYIKKLVNKTVNEKIDFGVLIDMRFPNEADYIMMNGGMTIRVNVFDNDDVSGGYKYTQGKNSFVENALDNYYMFDYEFYREIFNGITFGKELEKYFQL